MIVELMKKNMRGLSFAEIRLQETIRYLDTMIRIASGQANRKLEELVENLFLHDEARRRYESKNSDGIQKTS